MVIFKNSIFIAFTVLILVCTQVIYADTLYKVKPSDSMDRITKTFYKESKLNKHQIYIGILAENPNAFRLGNINHLKSGQTLSLPDHTKLLTMEPKDAANLVAEHNDNASKGLKVKIDPPFEGYSPKNKSVKDSSSENNNSSVVIQQNASKEELDRLSKESEALRLRLEQLISDKEAMDAELIQLDSLIKQK